MNGQITRYLPSFPVVKTLREYSVETLRKDGLAGVSVGLIAVPQCMAYALIADLPPVYGLYAGMIGVFLGSLFGSSHHLITGPNGIISLVVGNMLFTLDQFSTPEVIVYLSVMMGLTQILFGILRVGDLARFVSLPVISGFMTAGAVVIMGDQIGNLLALESKSTPYFLERMLYYLSQIYHLQSFNPFPLLIGLLTIWGILGLRYVRESLPAVLIVVVGFGVVSYLFRFNQIPDVDVVGSIPAELPGLVWPGYSPELFTELFGGALALALLSSVQAISVSKSLAQRSLQANDQNQELIGQGVANIGCGFLGGFPGSASLSRSFLNFSSGAQTRVAGMVCGAVIALIVAFFGPLAYYIPMPCLAGVIMVIAFDIIDWEQVAIALTTTYRDQIVFATTFLVVMIQPLDRAIYAGIIISLILYIRKASQIDMKEYIIDKNDQLKQIYDLDERIEEAVAIIDINGDAFFGSADLIKDRIQHLCDQSDDLRVIVLRMKNAMNLDITGAMAIKQIAQMLKERNMTLMISGATPHVQDLLEETGVADYIGRDKILIAQKSLLKSTRQALTRAQAHIDNVLEGEEAWEKESDPPLRYTLEKKENNNGESGTEDPVIEEKTDKTYQRTEDIPEE